MRSNRGVGCVHKVRRAEHTHSLHQASNCSAFLGGCDKQPQSNNKVAEIGRLGSKGKGGPWRRHVAQSHFMRVGMTAHTNTPNPTPYQLQLQRMFFHYGVIPIDQCVWRVIAIALVDSFSNCSFTNCSNRQTQQNS